MTRGRIIGAEVGIPAPDLGSSPVRCPVCGLIDCRNEADEPLLDDPMVVIEQDAFVDGRLVAQAWDQVRQSTADGWRVTYHEVQSLGPVETKEP